jgi:hypothetical protein
VSGVVSTPDPSSVRDTSAATLAVSPIAETNTGKLSNYFLIGFQIHIRFMRIRIQGFEMYADLDPDPGLEI